MYHSSLLNTQAVNGVTDLSSAFSFINSEAVNDRTSSAFLFLLFYTLLLAGIESQLGLYKRQSLCPVEGCRVKGKDGWCIFELVVLVVTCIPQRHRKACARKTGRGVRTSRLGQVQCLLIFKRTSTSDRVV